MLETNTRGLPTTLFFNAEGRLVDTHMGELTRATLADTLRRRFDAPAATTAQPWNPPSPSYSDSSARCPQPRSGLLCGRGCTAFVGLRRCHGWGAIDVPMWSGCHA